MKQPEVDISIDVGQLLISLPPGVEINRIKQILWRIGVVLNNSNDLAVQAIGEAIEKKLCELETK